MTSSFAGSLDALGSWRHTLLSRLDEIAHFLVEHDLLDEVACDMTDALRQRLSSEKLVLAFVAEFSRGKSELINAIFFADTGRRVLPATPGRTTMCPVELGYDAEDEPRLALLPIETRLESLSLSELRAQPRAWTLRPLPVDSPEQLAEVFAEVTRTQRVAVEQARALGFWNDDSPEDNPPIRAGLVEVPVWRHALVNYPHPLLKRGLVVLDTPGLNAIGAEPELTLGLLPAAHAIVFILGADTGVTKSDLAIWRDHLAGQGPARFVALNKIDALFDPLSARETVHAQIERQRQHAAQTLGIDANRVFPISARQALAARVEGNDALLDESRLPELESALALQLLPQRQQVLEQMLVDGTQRLEAHVTRRLADRRRQVAEQMHELRGLRGKSNAKVRTMLQRVDAETTEFEQCTARLHAMRAVHSRMLKDALVDLSSERLRDEVAEMQRAMSGSWMNLGAKRAFVALCARLHRLVQHARQRGDEIHEMLSASFAMLNSDYGFGLSLTTPPTHERTLRDLDAIEAGYVQYLGLTHALRLSQPKFMEQFRRMLTSKLRVVFESASGELELWNKAASAQVDSQLRERRRAFKRRREALERIQGAAGELEQRIAEFEAQDARLRQFQSKVRDILQSLREEHWDAEFVDLDLPLPLTLTDSVEAQVASPERVAA
jgi:hypothetical protein